MSDDLTIEAAPDILEELVGEALAQRAGEKPATAALRAFQRFVAQPVPEAEPARESLLASFGTSDGRGHPEFFVGATRLLVTGDEHDDPGSQYSAELRLYWPASPETTALGAGDVWSPDAPGAFWEALVRLPGWAWALTSAAAEPDVFVDGQWV